MNEIKRNHAAIFVLFIFVFVFALSLTINTTAFADGGNCCRALCPAGCYPSGSSDTLGVTVGGIKIGGQICVPAGPGECLDGFCACS